MPNTSAMAISRAKSLQGIDWLLAIAGLTAFKCIDVAHRGALLWHRIASLRQSQNLVADNVPYRGPDSSPSARHRDEMIRQGLMS
jgi:hypothetical protein